MQADFVRKRPALKHGYIDPSPIASTNFNYPKEWKLDCKDLEAGKTLKGERGHQEQENIGRVPQGCGIHCPIF
jgi:hypothetical protein